MAPILSVVVPVYNMQATVLHAVCAALNQFSLNLEVIVVDDGSGDASAAVVNALCNPRVRIIRQPNSGVESAINAGFSAAAGKYLYSTSADDWLEPDCLSYAVEIMEHDPAAGFVYGAVRYHNDLMMYYVPQPFTDDYFYHHYAAISGYVFRREAFCRGARLVKETIPDWDHALQLVEMGYKGVAVQVLMLNYWYIKDKGVLADIMSKKELRLAQLKTRFPKVDAVGF